MLLLCLIFGLHHEEEAAGLGDEDSCIEDFCPEDEAARLGDEDDCLDVHHEDEAATSRRLLSNMVTMMAIMTMKMLTIVAESV